MAPSSTDSQSDNKSNIISRLSKPLPTGTWDSHTHVINPDTTKYPFISTAEYHPSPHTVDDAVNYYRSSSGLGIAQPRMLLTQVSVYGRDNGAMLDGLRALSSVNGKGRALVEMDPDAVSSTQLHDWHQQGVRGARVNLVSVSRQMSEAELQTKIQRYVACFENAGLANTWVLELYVPLSYMDMLVRIIPPLDTTTKFVVDHFAGLDFRKMPGHDPAVPVDPYALPGFTSLLELLAHGSTWCKISGFYRVTKDIPLMRDLEPVGRELVRRAAGRVVWASDWPHTRFETVDSVPFVEMCYAWCDEAARELGVSSDVLRTQLFKTNAEELWDAKE